MAGEHCPLSGEDLARPAEDLPLKAIRDLSYKLHRPLSNSGNWETIAEELGYDWESIKQFQALAAVRQEATPGEIMLQDWRQRGNGRTLYVLHDALKAAGRLDCVELLEKEIYEKLVCIDLRVCIKHENNKIVEHIKVRTRMEATLMESLFNHLQQPIRDNYRLLDHLTSWTQTLAKEFRGRELMVQKMARAVSMEQDPTVDSSSAGHSQAQTPDQFRSSQGYFVPQPRYPSPENYVAHVSSNSPSIHTNQHRGSIPNDDTRYKPAVTSPRQSPLQLHNVTNLNDLEHYRNNAVSTAVPSNQMNILLYSIPSQSDNTSLKLEHSDQVPDNNDVPSWQSSDTSLINDISTDCDYKLSENNRKIPSEYNRKSGLINQQQRAFRNQNEFLALDYQRTYRKGLFYREQDYDHQQHHDFKDPEGHGCYRDSDDCSEYRDPHSQVGFIGSDHESVMSDTHRLAEEHDEYRDPHTLPRAQTQGINPNMDHAQVFAGCLDPATTAANVTPTVNEPVSTCTEEYQLAYMKVGLTDQESMTSLDENASSITEVKQVFNTELDASESSSGFSVESSDTELVVAKIQSPLKDEVAMDEMGDECEYDGATCVFPGEIMQTDDGDEERYYLDFNKYPQVIEGTNNNMGDIIWSPSESEFAKLDVTRGQMCFQSQSSDSRRRREEFCEKSQSTVVKFRDPEPSGFSANGRFDVNGQVADTSTSPCNEAGQVYESLHRQFSQVSSTYATPMSLDITIAEAFSPHHEDTTSPTALFSTVSVESDPKKVVSDPFSTNSISNPESRSESMRVCSSQEDTIFNERARFFKPRHSMPIIGTTERPVLHRQTTVCELSHPYKLVIGGKTSRPSLDKFLAGDKIFSHYNQALKGYPGWSPRETENTVMKTMQDTLKDEGYFIMWYCRGKQQLVISISHRGKLENFRIFTKVLKDLGLVFYIYKPEKFKSILELVRYYSMHGLVLPAASGSRSPQVQGHSEGQSQNVAGRLHLRCPVLVQYDNTPAVDV